MRDTAIARQRQLTAAAVALVAILVLILGIYYYRTSSAKDAQKLQYQGYKTLEGMYDASALEESERARKALELFQKSYETRKAPATMIYIAESHTVLGEYEQALAALDRVTKEFPGDYLFAPMANFKKASIYLKTGEKEKALEAFNGLTSAGVSVPFGDLALMESARLLEGMGRTDEAMQKYEIIANRYPESMYYQVALEKTGRGVAGAGGIRTMGEESSEGSPESSEIPPIPGTEGAPLTPGPGGPEEAR